MNRSRGNRSAFLRKKKKMKLRGNETEVEEMGVEEITDEMGAEETV